MTATKRTSVKNKIIKKKAKLRTVPVNCYLFDGGCGWSGTATVNEDASLDPSRCPECRQQLLITLPFPGYGKKELALDMEDE